MAKKEPGFYLYTGDWKKDPNLCRCSPATRGVWIDLLCAMHDGDHQGKIGGTIEQLAVMARCSPTQIEQAIEQISRLKVGIVRHRGKTITIINRRMAREYAAKHGNAQRQQRFREKGGGDPARWTAIRVDILRRDEYKCAYCGRKATTVDHIVPRRAGGTEAYENLAACCKSCNCRKNNRSVEEAQMEFTTRFIEARRKSNTENNKSFTTPYPLSSSSSDKNTTTTTRARGVTSALPELIKLWNASVPKAQQVHPDGTPAIDRAYSGLVNAAPPIGADEIKGAIENYRLALAVENSQAHPHSLGGFLRRENIERYLPGNFNVANYDRRRFAARDGPDAESPEQKLEQLRKMGQL